MAWIFVSSIAFCQQQSALQVTPIDGLETGLKNSGCTWILVAFERMSETKNQIFSMDWRFLRNPLDNNYGSIWKPQLTTDFSYRRPCDDKLPRFFNRSPAR
jgi:hypothetical protein